MPITTDRTITVHGVEIGISKPIQTLIANGDFTYNELSNFAFVGRHDFINDFIGIYDSELQETGSASSLLAKNKYPAMNDPAGAWSNIKYLYTGKGERPYDAYGKMVLVYNRTASASAIQNNYSDSNSACIVTDINPRLLKMIPNITHSTVTATYGEPGTYDIYDAEASISIKWYDDNSTAPFSTLCVQKYDTYEYFTFPLYDNRATSTEVISGNTGSTKARMYYMNDDFNRTGNKFISPWAQTDDIDDFAAGASYSSTWNCVNKVNTDRANRNLILKYRGSPYYEGTIYVKAADLDAILKQCAGCGLYFEYNGTIYKPVVEGGIVTGYTDNLMHNSEWDLINDVTGNTIPNVPNSGGGGGANGDELTDMLSRGQFYGSGLTKYYVDPPAAKLQKALGDWDNISTGKDVLQNLLSYKILCFPSTTFSNGMTDPFVIAGVELKDENDATITAKRLTSTGAVNLPTITITPTFNDFRDYAPYTKIQMFIPLCGWFDLPPWCMGRSIGGEMYINPYSGTVRCLVRADGNVVAELGGNASIDLPFNATAVGMKSAAVISNLIQTAGAVGRAAMLPTVNTLAGAGSAALGTICAMNANYTESKGTMGDGSNVYGLYNVYIKITRPATIDNSGNSIVTIPTQYCHDYGRPCNKQLTLTAGDGYTQIMDANITGAMTDREKQMIIDGFRHGLIL